MPRQFSLNKKGDLVSVRLQTDGTVVVMRRDVRTGEVFPLRDEGDNRVAIEGLGIKYDGGELGPVCLVCDE